MFKISLVLLFTLIFNACASGSKTSSVAVQKQAPKIDKLHKQANAMGCRLLKNQYMVCPKSMNR